ncbi:MAG: adenylyl-sulfate kinase [Myxococcota bacterium]|nr:adenylyl-sulfate kinase [Myxococcota bacterium]
MTISSNVTRHPTLISPEERARQFGHSAGVVWLTGLSGSGKSTIAMAVEQRLVRNARFAFVLDGDNVRHGLCGDLSFSNADRAENIRRVGEVARLFFEAGAIVLCAFVSPSEAARSEVRARFPADRFIEVHLKTPLAACEARDPKGLYRRARSGQIKDFTGISAPYEAPSHPELSLDTSTLSVESCADHVFAVIESRWLRV